MRRLFFATALLLLACMALPHAAQAQWTEAKLQKLYIDALRGEGMTGKVDADGDVQFTYSDHTYFIEVNEGDTEFFRVVLPNIWPIESIQEHGQVLMACDAVNKSLKTVKAYVANDDVWIAVEMFVSRPDNFQPVFKRCLNVIEAAVDKFVEAM